MCPPSTKQRQHHPHPSPPHTHRHRQMHTKLGEDTSTLCSVQLLAAVQGPVGSPDREREEEHEHCQQPKWFLCSCPSPSPIITDLVPEPDAPQEDIAGEGLLVPDGQLQADVVEVPRLQAAVGEGVVPPGVHALPHHRGLVLRGFVVVREKVSDVPPYFTAVRFLASLISSSTIPPLGSLMLVFFPFRKPFFSFKRE
ncbi:hypothetical protein JZ751_023619, partial [Albula glossodonta]